MIDEKKFIESCFEYAESHKALNISLSDIQKILSEQPKVGEWIPCDKQLPKGGVEVLVSIDEMSEPMTAWYDDIRDVWHSTGYVWYSTGRRQMPDNAKITAWQPLPEIYKG